MEDEAGYTALQLQPKRMQRGEDQEGYMVLNFQPRQEQRRQNSTSRVPDAEFVSMNQDIQQHAQRHWVALKVTCAVNLILTAVLISVAIGEEAQDCTICPGNWRLHRDNCYWFSERKDTWRKSQDACRANNSTVLVIQNQEEMTFIKNIITTTQTSYWLGLTAKQGEGRTLEWVDQSPFKEELFSVVGPDVGNNCGMLKADKVNFDSCDSLSRWICKKVAFSI
ncbi:killer cell lectin-like receptor subfamily B member 1F [Hemicordylus capensis]|uniref:killer cell lectin-like receptor subfamily B member 1F n=1 Tax=Hemicordylus capensis TaxID=884348 RepID=UPI0023043C69|nr:killer cell lectin-like receptor subfamily B member 1F [Hemicordylus capensis]